MKPEIKKLLILNAPYLLFVYLFDKLGEAVRLAPGVDIGLYVLCRPPSCRTVLNALAVFLGVLAFDVDGKPDNERTRNPDQEVYRVETGRVADGRSDESVSIENQELLCRGWSHHLIHMTAVHLWQNGTLQL